MVEKYPGRLILGLDARDGRVATGGWLDVSSVDAADLALQFDDLPLAAVIYTDIARDGMLEGPNLETTEALARRSEDAGDGVGGRGPARRPGATGDPAGRGLHRRTCSVRRAFPAQRGAGTRRRPFHGTLTRAS